MTQTRDTQPGAKGAGDENFPVASVLIAPALRPHIRAFYAFARAADDIADDPRLGPDEKCARLDAFADALSAGPHQADGPAAGGDNFPARALAASLAETGVSPAHALDLLAAFRQDAVKRRYVDWPDLMDYCRFSAAPCGRYLLALHGDAGVAGAAETAADALSAALQVINHIQDCRDDYQTLDRVYIPLDWLGEEGADVGALACDETSPALRRVLDRMLIGVDRLLAEAGSLPGLIGNPRLALEAAVVLVIARKLSRRLRAEDPLAGRIALTRVQFSCCAMIGFARGLCARWRRRH